MNKLLHFLLQALLICCTVCTLSGQDLASTQSFPLSGFQAGKDQKQNKTLQAALIELESRFKVSIMADKELLDGKTIKSARSYPTLEEALKNLLKETNLTYEKISKDFYVISLSTEKKQSYIHEIEVKPTAMLQTEISKITFSSIEKLSARVASSSIEKVITVSGRVTSETNEGIPGVNVLLKGTTTGTTTNGEGQYSLTVPDGNGTLIFSYIGYTTEEIPVNNRSIIDVSLVPDIKTLSEVVVVGYGTQNKSDLTGAIAQVKGSDLRDIASAGIDRALQGRVAGVRITQNSARPGGDISVNIRGTTSINGSQPLYVVDGVPISNSNFGINISQNSAGDLSGTFNMINPADIESIEILKDASASAIYGSRGASGVVLITTKRGKANSAAVVSFDSYYGTQSIVKKYDIIDARQYAINSNASQINGGQVPYRIYSNIDSLANVPSTNWQDAILRNAPIQSYQLNVSGGTDKVQYSIGGGYFDQQGIIIGSGFQRYSLKANIDLQANKRFKIGTSLLLSTTKEKIVSSGFSWGQAVWSNAISTSPLIPVRNADGTWGGPRGVPGENGSILNPVAQATDWNNENNNKKLIGNVYGEFKILEGLTYRISGGADIFMGESRSFSPTFAYGAYKMETAALRVLNGNSYNLVLTNTLNYIKTLNAHSINAVLGQEAVTFDDYSINAFKERFPNNELQYLNLGGVANQDVSEGASWNSLLSFFARANYVYKDRYLVTGTIRADGSSKFAPSNRWGYFPSLSVAWRVSNEPFFNTIPVINDLKIRLGYGVNGNQAGIRNYAYLPTMNSGNMIMNGERINTAFYGTIANEDTKWEAVIQRNIGIDVAILKSRLSLTADYYIKETSDMLLAKPVPLTTGMPQSNGQIAPWVRPVLNIGSMTNKGIELSVTANNNFGDIEWISNANFSINRNEFKSLAGSLPIYGGAGGNTTGGGNITVEGKPVGMFYGWVYEGIFRNAEDVTGHAYQDQAKPGDTKFKDLNLDGVIDDKDRTFIGDPNPKFTYGFNNAFLYKGFDLNVFLQGVHGNKIYNVTHVETSGMLAADVNNRWTQSEDVKRLPRLTSVDGNNNSRSSSLWIEDGSYLKIRNITLGYSLPANLVSKANIQKLRFYVSAQNYFTFTKYSGMDPEVGSNFSSTINMGFDWFSYPVAKTLLFGANITF
jgi:TonB-linked SusC/RagA family outer membrane protein